MTARPGARRHARAAPATAPRPGLSDGRALALLTLAIVAVGGNRLAFDAWLTRMDLFTFFLPWYSFLGERLRDLAVPGWNPHLFSGAPFAGDPESGWMYLPAMLAFSLISTATSAFKGMVMVQLAGAALSTYAFARALGMGALAALAAAVIYLCGPFLTWNTYCCLVFAQFATWIPLALLGVELALRARRWQDRLLPWCLGGFAVSQMLAGWVGEGWLYAMLLPAAYVGYRTLIWPANALTPNPSPVEPGEGSVSARRDGAWQRISASALPLPARRERAGVRADSGNRDRPCSPTPPLPTRLLTGAITGLAILGFGLALGAAGVLPRLAVNPETNLAGGDYARLGEAGVLNPPWHLDYLLLQTLGAGSGYHVQAASFGGAAVVLSLLAIPLAGRRYAVPFFLALTLAAMILTLETTPLHLLFYLIPRYREFHDHDAWRAIALTAIGPAMMSGAALDALPRWRGRWRLLPIVVAPLLLLTILTVRVWHPATFVGWLPLIAAAIATALVAVVVVTPADRRRPTTIGQVANLMPAAILAVAFLVPTGLQLSGSWLGWPHSEIWDERWRSDPAAEAALTADSQWSDPGGAGEFLQRELAASGPFRYAGYGGFGYASDADLGESYMGRRFDPNITALLVNGRPIHLGLYDVQGYNPLQLSRYVEFMTTLNGAEQDYHTAFLLASGAQSPLLDLLDVRYLLVDAALPPARDDVRALTAGAQEVFRTPQVIVYERSPTPRHAWIVHDVRQVSRGEALPLLGARVIDPYRLALVEETPPATGQPAAGAEESARVVQQSPDSLTIATRAAAPGLLVVSEIYEAGWRAFVDGSPAPLLPTDHALQGIPLPAGAHTVELRYAPIALRVGLGISGIAALALLAILVTAGWSFVARRHRPSGDSPPAAGTRTRPHPS